MLRIGIFGSTVLILTAGAALAWPSQAGPPGAQGHPSLREYYEGLVKGTMAPPQLTNETGGRFLERVTSATHDEVSEALPAILAASQSKDPDVQRFGILALLAVNDRHSDQYELLSKYLPELTALLSSGDSRVAGVALTSINDVWRSPPLAVVAQLLQWLKEGDVKKGAGALQYLVTGAANQPGVVRAVLEFWLRPMDTRDRISAIQALSNGRPKDPRLVNLVISSLDDPDSDIQWVAFQAVTRMGPAALEQGKLPMQRVADEYVSLVKQEDADPNKQNEAIEDLRFYAPNDPEVVNALVKFYSRPIGRHYLDALRNNRFKDFRIPDLVIASLHDPDPDVRGTAASVLGDMGPDALMRAEPALKALAEDPAQPARVKEAANRSLKSLAEWERSRSH